MTDLLEFIEGQLDCKTGRAIPEDASKARIAGYDLEYQREEMNSNGYNGTFSGNTEDTESAKESI